MIIRRILRISIPYSKKTELVLLVQEPPKKVMSSKAMKPLAREEPQIPSMIICKNVHTEPFFFYIENLFSQLLPNHLAH